MSTDIPTRSGVTWREVRPVLEGRLDSIEAAIAGSPEGIPSSVEIAAMRDVLDAYQDGQDATDLAVAALLNDPTDTRGAARGVVQEQVESPSPTRTALDARYARPTVDNGFSTTQTIQAIRFSSHESAMRIVSVDGTNGKRLSMQPHDPSSDKSAQLELVPGTTCPASEVTSQILLYHKPGANYERFVISCFNNEYQFHASRLGTGVARPTFFYVDNVLSSGWMADAAFRVYQRLEFFDASTQTLHGSLRGYASGILGTTASFRVAEGQPGQVRIGNVAGLNRPTITFGADGLVNVNRNSDRLEVNGAGGLRVIGGFAANNAVPQGKQTLSAAATDAATTQTLVNQIRAALITIGLAQ